MPRRLPLRPAKIIGNVFVCIALSYISLIYYLYVFILWSPFLQQPYSYNTIYVQLILVVFHSLVFMLLWSFFQAMLTDPGQVPIFWGFH